ncbi:tetratricopeptide repeat protein [Polaromonas sp. CG_9.11]|uniref:tetratricopeptide repeat protein n=1 Tax=Polaromonas sp. CG_9.11 TaxID=2787730 RepID=UPI0018CA0075|nr:tetratricopeptide repeat protein [Polaromonas sp. CG_9.11]MBG6074942.1 tetratricopeptide (TPR) repeat protein [Polaromonas sp. CG_9.11]
MQLRRVFSQYLVYLFLKTQALALLALSKHTKALSRFDRMLEFLPADRYALASRAHVLVQLNRLDESIKNLQQLTSIAGSKTQLGAAWFNLAYILQQKGRHDEACPAFENAVGHCPGMDQAWYGLGLVLIGQGKLHEARSALKQATTLQPMAPHGWYRLAHVELALGSPEDALRLLEHLRQFEPKVGAQLEQDIDQYVPWSNR